MIWWILYALFEGYREGNFWSIKHVTKIERNYHEHTLWSFQRAVVLVAICRMDWLMYPCLMLVFPFLHDGAYYFRRNMLDSSIYSKGFMDHSKTSTAILTKYFPPVVRVLCALVGIVLNLVIINF